MHSKHGQCQQTRLVNGNNRDDNDAMGVSLLEHWRNEEILEEARVEPIAMTMIRRRLEWLKQYQSSCKIKKAS